MSKQVAVEFCSRFLRPAEAVLALVGRRQGASVGSTLVFTLSAQVDNVSPKVRATSKWKTCSPREGNRTI